MERNNDKNLNIFPLLPPFPGSTSLLYSWLFYSCPEWCKKMGNGSSDQSIPAPLCHSFLLTLFPCSSIEYLPWAAVLQDKPDPVPGTPPPLLLLLWPWGSQGCFSCFFSSCVQAFCPVLNTLSPSRLPCGWVLGSAVPCGGLVGAAVPWHRAPPTSPRRGCPCCQHFTVDTRYISEGLQLKKRERRQRKLIEGFEKRLSKSNV